MDLAPVIQEESDTKTSGSEDQRPAWMFAKMNNGEEFSLSLTERLLGT